MINRIQYIYILFFSMLFFGCDNWIEGYDDDPNSSSEVSIDNLLTASQVNLFNFSENHLARSVAIWMQQMAGTDRQYKSLGLYSFEENDYSSSWQSVYINGGLKDLRKIQLLSDKAGKKFSRYKGISQFMEAYLIGMAASIWGDIPYSQILDNSVDNPILDEQMLIYESVQSLLDSAILNFASDTTSIPSNDMFYNGDIKKWKEAAYSLKARFYMHWIDKDQSNCVNALENANKGISSLDGTLKTLHGTESSEQNIWYQFEQDRSGYMVAGSNLVQLLKSSNDARDSIYFGKNDAGTIVGANINNDGAKGKSYLNDKYFGSDASIDILSYEENLLIQAECYYRSGDESSAQTKLEKAYSVAEEKWGISLPSYFNSNTSLLDKIIKEKYIALFLNIEIWNDYKRNCYPEVRYKKSEDDNGNPIYDYPPRRIYYPEDERITNTNIPSITQQPVTNDNDLNECRINE